MQLSLRIQVTSAFLGVILAWLRVQRILFLSSCTVVLALQALNLHEITGLTEGQPQRTSLPVVINENLQKDADRRLLKENMQEKRAWDLGGG